MAYAIKVTIKKKRVYVGNNGVPAKYTTKDLAKKDIDRYLKNTTSKLRPMIVKYPDVKVMPISK